MKNLWGIAFGVVCGLLGAGLLFLVAGEPRGEPIRLIPPPTPLPVIVHVAGAVNSPGVLSLPHGSRVKDAVEQAGGLAGEADASLINLAMPVMDGMQIWVPSIRQEPVVEEVPIGGEPNLLPEHTAGLININLANQEELEALPGIGPVIAQAIIQYRLDHGPYEQLSDIQAVKGIGPVVFEKIEPFITLGGAAGD